MSLMLGLLNKNLKMRVLITDVLRRSILLVGQILLLVKCHKIFETFSEARHFEKFMYS